MSCGKIAANIRWETNNDMMNASIQKRRGLYQQVDLSGRRMNLAIRDLIQTFLSQEGYAVQAFADGDDLMAAFIRQPADLVILDIMMPGTDGLTLCNQLRQRSAVPIIIVSARDSELDRITGMTLGSDDY